MGKWFSSSQIRNLVDMHIPNGEGYLEKFDPVKYAENVKRSGATTAYIYSSNCLGLCFYPTKVGLRHKEAERDIFGETVKECRKRGLKVVGYTNTWATFVADKHPEWNVRYADGSCKRDKLRFGTPCVNNDEFIEYVAAQSRELVSSYKLDGYWLDMVGIAAPVCYCDSCKRKYYARFGRELPTELDPNSKEFYEYLEFKTEAVGEYLRRVKEAVKEADNDITVAFQTASAAKHALSYGTAACFEHSEYCSGDFYTERTGVNVICRMLYKATNQLPFEFMTSRCVSLERHTMNKNIYELLIQSYCAMMHKGAFLFIDAIDPDGEMNAEFYDDISLISKECEKYIPYITYDDKALRDVAVFYNHLSDIPESDEKMSIGELRGFYLYDRLRNVDKKLSEAHIDYDLISSRNISELGNYKAVILPALSVLAESEAEAIRKYVADGGCLYVSAKTSLRNEKGEKKSNFMLSDVLGVDYCGQFDIKPNYLSPVEEDKAVFAKHTRKYPHMLEERMVKVVPNSEGKVLATVTLPIGDVSDNLVFSSAISDPPINFTSFPAIFEHSYGKGRVIYCAGELEQDPMPDSAQLFVSLIDRLTGKRSVELHAPTCVEHTAYSKEDQITVHLLNNQAVYPPIKIADLSIELDIGDKAVKEIRDISGGVCEWSVLDGRLTVHTDLEIYKLIVVVIE